MNVKLVEVVLGYIDNEKETEDKVAVLVGGGHGGVLVGDINRVGGQRVSYGIYGWYKQ